MKILLATQNENKRAEIIALLSSSKIKIITLKDLKDFDDVEETGRTFAQNARLKANYYGAKHQMFVLSDDSGLEVESLNHRPGIYSKRYSQKGDYENNLKILAEMNEIENRRAQFVCVLAFYNPHAKNTLTFEGVLKGSITKEIRGENGFGYDPIFLLEDKNQTLAEIGFQEKNQLSHRTKALLKFKEYLYANFDFK